MTDAQKEQLGNALKEAQACTEHAEAALTHLDELAKLILAEDAAQHLKDWHGGDLVAADDYLQVLLADLGMLEQRARTGRRKVHAIGKLTDKVVYGLEKLYGPLRKAADEERSARAKAQQAFTFVDPLGASTDPASVIAPVNQPAPKKRGRRAAAR